MTSATSLGVDWTPLYQTQKFRKSVTYLTLQPEV